MRKLRKCTKGIFQLPIVVVLLVVIACCASSASAAYYDEGNDGNSWETAYVIDSVEDFMLMRERTDSYRTTRGERGKYYKITADLDVSAETGMNIPSSFLGHIDGQNHTLKINIQSDISGAIFMEVSADQVAIKNLNVSGNCKGSHAGGIVYLLSAGIIENCSFSGTLEGEIAAGIALGINGGTSVKNCTFTGKIIASGPNVIAGGIVGQLRGGSIDNCTVSSGTVITCNSVNEQAGGFAGGIAGMTSSLTEAPSITNCTSYAVLEGNVKYKGGIAGTSNNPFAPALILSGNTWPNQYEEVGFNFDISIPGNGNTTPAPSPTPNPSPAPVTSQDTVSELEIAIIAPVVLSDEVIARIAQNISVDPSELILLTSADFDPSDPPKPTQAMIQEVSNQNGSFMAKLNTINVKKDGWYVFMVTVSDDLVGTPVSSLKLYGAEASDFAAGSLSASFGLMPVINGITGMFEVNNFLGIQLDTVPKQFLTVMFLSAGKSLTVYIVKILLLLLGGCNTGGVIMLKGVAIVSGGFIIAKFLRRKQ